jgi:hypothetical protein
LLNADWWSLRNRWDLLGIDRKNNKDKPEPE